MTGQEQGTMLATTEQPPAAGSIAAHLGACRGHTEALCRVLAIEDHVVQPAPYVSPPKWHLAHTTWFFDNFILDGIELPSSSGAHHNLLFNSYYKSQGEHWLQSQRGHLSRPTVQAILDYRAVVTEALQEAIAADRLSAAALSLVELGIHHEQQHQELLLMDIKYILGTQPSLPAYDDVSVPSTGPDTAAGRGQWLSFDAGMVEAGHPDGQGFAYDNESPRHRHWLPAFRLACGLVRNRDYLAFIEDGGYRRPEYWLSDGWDWLQQHGIESPLYWHAPGSTGAAGDGWSEYHLGGLQPLAPDLPVSHVSYYEADAFARWAGARLPTEFELESAAAGTGQPGKRAFWVPGERVLPAPDRAADRLENGLLWQWTSSAYGPYPGYRPAAGALGEYNGKFMSGQQVLRGGCVATPRGHWRNTYRNFYRPADRWPFTGIRLAADPA